MVCGDCGTKTKVVDSRLYCDPNQGFDYMQRRRKCLECGEVFNTIEVTVDVWEENTSDS